MCPTTPPCARLPRFFTSLSILALAACSGGSGSGTAPGDEAPDPQPFTVEGLNAMPGVSTIQVEWASSQVASGRVEWGNSPSLGESFDLGLLTDTHSTQLTGLLPGSVYYVRVESVASDGQSASLGPISVLTQPVGSFQSDDFNHPNLDRSIWRLEDPHAQASLLLEGSGSGAASLRLSIPEGPEYQPWLTNGAARISQMVQDEDMTLEARFTGGMQSNGVGHGFTFEQDPQTFLRFDFAFNANKVQLFAATFRDGSLVEMNTINLFTGPWPAPAPLHMRVTRAGNNWTQEWGEDGINWSAGAAFEFDLVLMDVSLFAANSGSPAAAHELLVDYVFSSDNPIETEDGPAPTDSLSPYLYRTDSTPLDSQTVRLKWSTDEAARAELRWGQDTNYTDGILTIGSYLTSHDVSINGLQAETSYHFQVVSSDQAGNTTLSADLPAETYPDGSTGQPSVSFWTGAPDASGVQVMRFGHNGDPQAQLNILGKVQDEDEQRLVEVLTLYYRLNQGPWTALAIGDDRSLSYAPWRLANEGDFNLELFPGELMSVPLIDGVYRNDLELVVEDDDLHVAYASAWLDYTPGVSWSLPASIDWSDANNLHAGNIAPLAQVVDGDWYVYEDPDLGSVLRTRPGALGYDRLIAIGQSEGAGAWSDYEVSTQFTVTALDPLGYTSGTLSYGVGFLLRWSGHTASGPYPQPRHAIYPFGGGFLYRWFDNKQRWEFWENENGGITTLSGSGIQLGITYAFKLRVEADPMGGTRYRMKQWPATDAEPADWTFDLTTSGTDDHPDGALLLVAHHADVLIGDVSITELP